MQEDVHSLAQQYAIPYYNYFRDQRFMDNDFEDMDHLNAAGAEKLSRIVNDEILQPILSTQK